MPFQKKNSRGFCTIVVSNTTICLPLFSLAIYASDSDMRATSRLRIWSRGCNAESYSEDFALIMASSQDFMSGNRW